MTPSDEFWLGLVCGVVIAIIIILLLIETSRKEQRACKRGPEENDDKFSWRGELEGKGIKNSFNCVEKLPLITIPGIQNIIPKIGEKNVCVAAIVGLQPYR